MKRKGIHSVEEEHKVLAVERVMTILEYLAKKRSSNLSDMARDINLHKSTLFRFLTTLSSLGYVYKDSMSEQYSLTQKMNQFVNGSTKYGLLHEFAIPVMEQLSKQTKETIHLATMENGNIHYIYKIESTQSLRVVTSSHSGGDAPIYCTGLGKSLLSLLSDDKKEDILKHLTYEKYTPHTITDYHLLLEELKEVKISGYAIDNEEHEEGIYCIASPIITKNGEAIAAISITGPAFRMKQNKEKYITLLKEKIRMIEKHIF